MTAAAPLDADHPHARLLLHVWTLSNAITTALVDEVGIELSRNSPIAVLTTLATHGRVRPRDLLHPTGLTSGGLAKVLDRLEELDLVTRRAGDDPDGRAVQVRLTRRGQRVEHTIVECIDRALADLTDVVDQIWAELDTIGCEAPPIDEHVDSRGTVTALARLGNGMTASLHSFAGPDDTAEVSESLLLCALVVEGEVRPRRLMELVGLSSGGVTKLVDRAVQRGWVARAYGALPDDRRAVTIALTAAGRRAFERGMSGMHQHCPELAAAMGALRAITVSR